MHTFTQIKNEVFANAECAIKYHAQLPNNTSLRKLPLSLPLNAIILIHLSLRSLLLDSRKYFFGGILETGMQLNHRMTKE